MTGKEDLKRASARGVAWNLVQNLVGRLLSLVVVAILGRILDRSAFGAVALALVVTGFAELVINQGYGEFITQSPKLTDEHLDTAFWFNGALGVILTGIVLVGAGPLAAHFAEPSVAPIVRWVSLSIFFRSFAVVPTGLLVRNLQFRSLSLRSVAASALGGAAGIGAAVAGLGIYCLVIQILVGDLAAMAILWRATEWRPGRRFSRECLKELSSFGAPVFGATVLAFVSRRLDTMIVAQVLNMTLLGVYSMGQRVYQIVIQLLNKSTIDVAFSAFSRLSDEEERRRAFYRVIEFTAVLCFPIYVGLAIVAGPLTISLFGPKWIDSAPVLSMFALSGLPFSLSYVHVAAIKSAARTRYLVLIQIVFLFVYLPTMIVMVSHGATAAAVAYLIACFVIAPVEIAFVIAALSLKLGEYTKALMGPSLATIAMAGVTIAVAIAVRPMPQLVRAVAETVAGGISYVVALRLMAPRTFRRCRDLALTTLRKRTAKPQPQ